MGLPDLFRSITESLLKNPGDKFSAEITRTGKQVIKQSVSGIKRSAVRYPGTGTIVETIVHKEQ